jgi:hypothetical protein
MNKSKFYFVFIGAVLLTSFVSLIVSFILGQLFWPEMGEELAAVVTLLYYVISFSASFLLTFPVMIIGFGKIYKYHDINFTFIIKTYLITKLGAIIMYYSALYFKIPELILFMPIFIIITNLLIYNVEVQRFEKNFRTNNEDG